MNTARQCQECQTPLAAVAENAFGATLVCPKCLLGLGVADPEATLLRDVGTREVETPDAATHLGDTPVSSHKSSLEIPDVAQLIGQFPNLEIKRLIGHGGMGAVYEARQASLDRIVALKILAPRLSQNQAFTDRFLREAKTLAKLAHPNIVMVFEFGQCGDIYYLLMEYVHGVNLRQAMQQGQLKSAEALAIVPQICDALQYAHDEGIVHRDIKPENILIDTKGRVKIADFGLAKLLNPKVGDRRLTGTQQVLGTLNYMAPEQIEGKPNVDHRADIYSLGVVFYELLTGELPLGRFAIPSDLAKVDPQLDEVVLRTLEKEPHLRYQQASEVKTAVQHASANQGLSNLELPPTLEASDFSSQAGSAADRLANSASQSSILEEPPMTAVHDATGPWSRFNQKFGVDPQYRTFPDENPAAFISLPFTIPHVYGGLAMAYGIARLAPDRMEIEFEVRDEILKKIKSKSKVISIPLHGVAAISHERGLFWSDDKVTVQSKTLADSSDIPNAVSGSFSLKTKRINRELAIRWVETATAALTDSSVRSLPMKAAHGGGDSLILRERFSRFLDNFAWLSHFQVSNETVNPNRVRSRFSNVRFWFISSGVLNFVLSSSPIREAFSEVFRSAIAAPESSAFYQWSQSLENFNLRANPFSESFARSSSLWIYIFSVMLFVAAGKMEKLNGYYFVAFVCAAALIPCYPTFLFCAPWALVGLLTLLLPSSISTFDQVDEEGNRLNEISDAKGNPLHDPSALLATRQTFVSRCLVVLVLLLGSLVMSSNYVSTRLYLPTVPSPKAATGEWAPAAAESVSSLQADQTTGEQTSGEQRAEENREAAENSLESALEANQSQED